MREVAVERGKLWRMAQLLEQVGTHLDQLEGAAWAKVQTAQ